MLRKSCYYPILGHKEWGGERRKIFSVLIIGNDKYSEDMEGSRLLREVTNFMVGYYMNLQSYKLEENTHPIKYA